MTANSIALADLPTCSKTGLTLPLSTSLALPDLDKHRAMIGVELEVMAKKLDRFGWERDRGTHAHDRMMGDWMDALQDFTLPEVQGACREWMTANSRKMPHEGDIKRLILAARQRAVKIYQDRMAQPFEEPRKPNDPERAARAQEIIAQAGFAMSPKEPEPMQEHTGEAGALDAATRDAQTFGAGWLRVDREGRIAHVHPVDVAAWGLAGEGAQ